MFASPYIEVILHHTSSPGDGEVTPEQQHRSLCASGRVFYGHLRLRAASERLLLEFAVQSGGWMSSDSPFARAGLFPADATWGHYDPLLYPDTSFPALSEPTVLFTERTGKLRGFRVPDPPGTGRTCLMLHFAERLGSEGCISTPDLVSWLQFCSLMADLHSRSISSIPLRVIYPGPRPHVSQEKRDPTGGHQ